MPDVAEIADTLERTPAALRLLLEPFDDDVLSAAPEAGEWSAKEVVVHLITCDGGAFRYRIEALIDGADEVPGFSAGAALDARRPIDAPMTDLLDELAAVRAESVTFVRSLDDGELAASAPYRDHGTFAARDFLLEWPFHDQDHIRQILDAVQRHYLPEMGDAMRTALTT